MRKNLTLTLSILILTITVLLLLSCGAPATIETRYVPPPPVVRYKIGAPAITPDGAVYQFNGCYVVPPTWPVYPGSCPAFATNAEGVMIRAFWNAVDTDAGFDWSGVLSHINTITNTGRSVALTLAIYSGNGPTDLAPDWLKRQIGSHTLTIDGCPDVEMPKYTNPVYLAALKGMITDAAATLGSSVDVVFIADGFDDESWPVKPLKKSGVDCDYTSQLESDADFSSAQYYEGFVKPLMTHYRTAFGAGEPIYWFGGPVLDETQRRRMLDHAVTQEIGYAPQSFAMKDSNIENTYTGSQFSGMHWSLRLYEDDVPLSGGIKYATDLSKEFMWYTQNKMLAYPFDLITVDSTFINAMDWTYYTNRRGSLPWTSDYAFVVAHSVERTPSYDGKIYSAWNKDLERWMYTFPRGYPPARVFKYELGSDTITSGEWNKIMASYGTPVHNSEYSRHFMSLDPTSLQAIYLRVDPRWKYFNQTSTADGGRFSVDVKVIHVGDALRVVYEKPASWGYFIIPASTTWTEHTESLTDFHISNRHAVGKTMDIGINSGADTIGALVHKIELVGSWSGAGSTPTPVHINATPDFSEDFRIPGTATPAGTSTPTPTRTPTVPAGSTATVTPTPTATPTAVPGGATKVVLHAIADTHIISGTATTNYGSQTSMVLVNDNSAMSMVQFNTSGIPKTAQISDAKLEVYVFTAGGTGSQDVEVYRVLRDWKEKEATWNVATTGDNWGTAGCNNTTSDRSGTAAGTATLPYNKQYVWLSFDVDDLVSTWVATPSTNKGVILRTAGAQNASIVFRTREYGILFAARLTVYYVAPGVHTPTPVPTVTGTPTPYLALTLTAPTPAAAGTPIVYTLNVQNLGANTFAGEVYLDHDDNLTFSAATPPADYNSGYAVGWTQERIFGSAFGSPTRVYVGIMDAAPWTAIYTTYGIVISDNGLWSKSVSHSATFPGSGTVTPTATPTPTVTPTPTPTTGAGTNTPAPTSTATPTITPTATPTFTPYPTPVYGVQINEICPVPNTDLDGDGVADSSDAFIELRGYYTGGTDVSGWLIIVKDLETQETVEYKIPATTIISPDDHLVIWTWQYLRENTAHNERTLFQLPAQRGCVSVTDNSGVTVYDSICYIVGLVSPGWEYPLYEGISLGRSPDGSTVNWARLEPSPGSSNG